MGQRLQRHKRIERPKFPSKEGNRASMVPRLLLFKNKSVTQTVAISVLKALFPLTLHILGIPIPTVSIFVVLNPLLKGRVQCHCTRAVIGKPDVVDERHSKSRTLPFSYGLCL